MLNSAPDLSASRWAPRPHGRTTSPYLSNQHTNTYSHAHHRTSTSPVRSFSPSKASTASAPTPLLRRPGPTPSQHRQQSLTLHHRLFQRLKWRASLLLTAHTFAQSPDTHGTGLTPAEADTQFRIDFFEFYVLLERCLLHLLAAVGVRVSAGYDPTRVNLSTTDHTPAANASSPAKPPGTIIGDSKVGAGRGAHAFHQNLLDALSEPRDNPLYPLLGVGRVREYIGLAKDLRNGWKESATAEDARPGGIGVGGGGDTHENGGSAVEAEAQRALHERLGRRYAAVLRELRLDEMLRVVLGAVEEAGVVAGREVERFVAAAEEEGGQEKAARRASVEMMDASVDEQQRGEKPWESMGLGAGWEGDEMEFD